MIHHADRVSNEMGHKHVCAHDMHVAGKCGCECYDESVGVWEEILSDTARDMVHGSSSSACPVNIYGACWYMGQIGDTCGLTCSRRHRAYVHNKYAPTADPILPHILNREPTLKHMAWAVHECYHPGDLLHGNHEGDRYMPSDPNGVGVPTPNLRRRMLASCGGLGQEPCVEYGINNGCKSFLNGDGTLVLDGNMCVGCGNSAEKVCTDHYGPNNGCAEGYSPHMGDNRCYPKTTASPTKAPTLPLEDEYFLPTDNEAHADLVAREGSGTGQHFSDPMCQLVCPCALLPNELAAEPTEAEPVEP